MKMFNALPTNPSISYGEPSDDDVSIALNPSTVAWGSFRMNIQFIGSISKITALTNTIAEGLTSFSTLINGLDIGNVYLGLRTTNFIVRETGVRYLKIEFIKYGGTGSSYSICLSQSKDIIDEPENGIEVDRMEVRCKISGLPINASNQSVSKVSLPFLQISNTYFCVYRQTIGIDNDTIGIIVYDSNNHTEYSSPITILSNPGRGLYNELVDNMNSVEQDLRSEIERVDQSLKSASNNFVSR